MDESSYKWTILQRNYRKMTILWSFSYSAFLKFHGKNGNYSMTMLCPNQNYNKVCYKGTELCILPILLNSFL